MSVPDNAGGVWLRPFRAVLLSDARGFASCRSGRRLDRVGVYTAEPAPLTGTEHLLQFLRCVRVYADSVESMRSEDLLFQHCTGGLLP